ncbi:hypothetical protein [Streptomyces sp. V4I2]|uniref:hypothetical protein n=1 Tax=Streptomyces sp. V4I2 TaxID=3042280 RepID=UPI002786D73A|nr:hypothetical protein [Streptomyces sp. V4I2]MDQ1042530.1 hypothetical protein [Streptomyces sp. V4I2]
MRRPQVSQALIYLADLQRETLHLLTGQGLDAAGEPGGEEAGIKIEGTLPGRAYQYGQILHGGRSDPEEQQWWVPLLNGTERLGVLRLTTQADDARTRENMELLASLLALIIVSKRQSSDSYARLMRTEPLNIAAEMQWHLMPPPTYADSRVAISAAMEPAHHVSGDAYDYATAGSVVHVSIFDAMGHDTAAGLTAALAMGTCRNTRHHADGLPVPETLRRLIHTLRDYHDGQLQDDATILICRWLGPADAPVADETDRT